PSTRRTPAASPWPIPVPAPGTTAMKRFALILFLGCCAFVGSAAAMLLAGRLKAPVAAQPAPSGAAAVVPGPAADVLAVSERFEAVARKVSPAVVYVEVSKPPRTGTAAGGRPARPVEESGSGVLIRVEGQKGFLVL